MQCVAINVSRDVPIIRSAIISEADMLLFYYIVSVQFAWKADIATDVAHAKVFLFNAHQEVCN